MVFYGKRARPRSWNLEAGYDFEITGKETTLSIAWQGTAEALALTLPEIRYLAVTSIGIFEHTTLSLEWAHDKDYSGSDGGTGDDTDSFTAQLAVEF